MLSLTILQIIWWLLLGLLLCGFSILGGIDLGVASLLPFIAKDDIERRVVINSIAPTWDGNQVWLIVGGGVIFAAWPLVYAAVFSAYYYAVFLMLFALILRPVGFDFRSKIESYIWRNTWDYLLCFSGILATICFGLYIGNLYIGLDFYIDNLMRITYSTIHFFDLFTPLPLLCAGMSVCAFISQGAMFLSLKTDDVIRIRALKIACVTPIIAVILFLCAGILLFAVDGFVYQGTQQSWSIQNRQGGWFVNYIEHPVLFVLPGLAIMACCISSYLAKRHLHGCSTCKKNALQLSSAAQLSDMIAQAGSDRSQYLAFVLSSSAITPLLLATFAASLFPFIVPCKTHIEMSLVIWNSSGSQYSLFVMLIAVIIFLPIVLWYTSWAYKLMFGKVQRKEIEHDKTHKFY